MTAAAEGPDRDQEQADDPGAEASSPAQEATGETATGAEGAAEAGADEQAAGDEASEEAPATDAVSEEAPAADDASEEAPAADATRASDEAPATEAASADDAGVQPPDEPAGAAEEGEQPAGEAPAGAPEEAGDRDEPAVQEAVQPPPAPLDLAAEARYSATGKRKSSIARVVVRPGGGTFEINGRSLGDYFPRRTLQAVAQQPLEVTGYLDRVDVRVKIHGGGVSSQADAVRHGVARALIEVDPNLRGELKRRQLLTRDSRVKERRKAGLKKARKRPQFSKR